MLGLGVWPAGLAQNPGPRGLGLGPALIKTDFPIVFAEPVPDPDGRLDAAAVRRVDVGDVAAAASRRLVQVSIRVARFFLVQHTKTGIITYIK
jgi:hypothetical protein